MRCAVCPTCPCRLCKRTKGCRAFTWGIQGDRVQCQLKRTQGPREPASGTVSGMVGADLGIWGG